MDASADVEGAESNVNPDRLEFAMRLAGIRSVAALATSLGKHEATVRNWTKERAQPHRSTLEDLARLLGVSPGFLTEPTALPDLHDAYFRSTSRTLRTTHDRIGAYTVLFGVLTQFLVGSRRAVDVAAGPTASAADAVRQRQGLSASGPVPNTIELAWAERVAVAFTPLDSSRDSTKADAFSARVGSTPVILLNPVKGDYYRQRFDVAHELGHLVMHRSSDAQSHGEREHQAHDFASRLLFPRTIENMRLLGRAAGEYSFDSLFAFQRQWGISVDALLHVATTMLTGRQRAAAREKASALRSGAISRALPRAPESVDGIADLVVDAAEDTSYADAVSFVALQSGMPRDYVGAMLTRNATDARPWPV